MPLIDLDESQTRFKFAPLQNLQAGNLTPSMTSMTQRHRGHKHGILLLEDVVNGSYLCSSLGGNALDIEHRRTS